MQPVKPNELFPPRGSFQKCADTFKPQLFINMDGRRVILTDIQYNVLNFNCRSVFKN